MYQLNYIMKFLLALSEQLTLIVTNSKPNEMDLNKLADAKVLKELYDFMMTQENQETSDELIVGWN